MYTGTKSTLFGCVAGCVLLASSLALAANATWNGGEGLTFAWNDNANWLGGTTFPNGPDQVATFPQGSRPTDQSVINLNQPITVGSIIMDFEQGSDANNYLKNGTGGSLTMDVTSGSALIEWTGTSSGFTTQLLCSFILADPLIIRHQPDPPASSQTKMYFSPASVTSTGAPQSITFDGTNEININAGGYNSSGVSQYIAATALNILPANALGGGSGSTPAPLLVNPGVQVTVANANALNGNTTLSSGAVLRISSAGLTGSGTISFAGPVKLRLNNTNALNGSQLVPSAVPVGSTIGLDVGNILAANLNALPAGMIFELPKQTTNRIYSNNGGGNFVLDNGDLLTTTDNNAGAKTGVSSGPYALEIGAGGATLSGAYTTSAPIVIDDDLLVHGMLTTGYNGTINGINHAGSSVRLTNSLNSFTSGSSINLANGTLEATAFGALGQAGEAVTATFNDGALRLAADIPNPATDHWGVSLDVQQSGTLTIDRATSAGNGQRQTLQNIHVASGKTLTVSAANTNTLAVEGQLSGQGTIAATALYIASGGILSPGDSAGALTINGSLYLSTATYLFDPGATPATSDTVIVTGALNFVSNPTVTVKLASMMGDPASQSWTLFSYGSTTGTQTWLVDTSGTGWVGGTVTQQVGNKTFVLSGLVPEPTTLALLALGTTAMALRRRR